MRILIVCALQQLLDLVVFVESRVDLGGELRDAGTLGVGFEEGLSLANSSRLLRLDLTDVRGNVLKTKPVETILAEMIEIGRLGKKKRKEKE